MSLTHTKSCHTLIIEWGLTVADIQGTLKPYSLTTSFSGSDVPEIGIFMILVKMVLPAWYVLTSSPYLLLLLSFMYSLQMHPLCKCHLICFLLFFAPHFFLDASRVLVLFYWELFNDISRYAQLTHQNWTINLQKGERDKEQEMVSRNLLFLPLESVPLVMMPIIVNFLK